MSEPGLNEGGGGGVMIEEREDVQAVVQCDFCDRETPSVRRVALDGEYERLKTPHQVRYSCPECFEKKNRERADA